MPLPASIPSGRDAPLGHVGRPHALTPGRGLVGRRRADGVRCPSPWESQGRKLRLEPMLAV
jgi:hypothetical protein